MPWRHCHRVTFARRATRSQQWLIDPRARDLKAGSRPGETFYSTRGNPTRFINFLRPLHPGKRVLKWNRGNARRALHCRTANFRARAIERTGMRARVWNPLEKVVPTIVLLSLPVSLYWEGKEHLEHVVFKRKTRRKAIWHDAMILSESKRISALSRAQTSIKPISSIACYSRIFKYSRVRPNISKYIRIWSSMIECGPM